MAEIRIHDSRSGRDLPLEPADSGQVGIYACGPTVYGRIHIGNARPYVVFSLLSRYLRHEGLSPVLVVNITDVNDKIYDAAKARELASARLAEQMTAHYVEDTDRLGLGRPDHEPLASESIPGIVDLIGALVDRGYAYPAGGDVFFRVRSDPSYGSLSHREVDAMDQGEGVEGVERKEDPLDFALWKGHKPGEDTAWESPWGRGRPGWHIECSAMAEQRLGVGFEIHGGGSDLVFPHHENEAAQTRCGRDGELAQIWMHNGMLQLGGEKMAKSVGNIESLESALDRWGRDTLIMFFCSGHYRGPLQYTDMALEDARARVERVREVGRRIVPGPSPGDMRDFRDRFFEALADDFNTARAIGALFEWVREANRRDAGTVGDADLREMLGVLALENLLEGGPEAGDEERALAEQRQTARQQRDFAEADRLRDELAARGWVVRDVAGGFELVPVEG